MKIITIGIDPAKSIFQIHGVDERVKAVLRKQLKRDQVAKFMANLAPCLVGMEACGSEVFAREIMNLPSSVALQT